MVTISLSVTTVIENSSVFTFSLIAAFIMKLPNLSGDSMIEKAVNDYSSLIIFINEPSFIFFEMEIV